MSERQVKDIAASVHHRLLNMARTENRPFGELLQYYAMERFLYRLSLSEHKSKFILKGALALVAVKAPLSRSTRDIDMKGEMSNDVNDVVAVVKKICDTEVESDGIEFDDATVVGDVIDDDDEYSGVRIRFKGLLGNAEIPMQLDISFGDVVVPEPSEVEYPTLLDFPHPNIRVYPFESTIAEKFEAMVFLGEVNSRMKDFYDIWFLSQNCDFVGKPLQQAFESTFRARSTTMPENLGFSLRRLNTDDKTKQWAAFIDRSDISDCPRDFSHILSCIREFLSPVVSHVVEGRQFDSKWLAPGPWINEEGSAGSNP